jgi:hypothetical protein
MAGNAVTGFKPSVNAFHFDNRFPDHPAYPVVDLPVVGRVISGDAFNGICGGFVFAVMDLWEHSPKLAPPDPAPSGAAPEAGPVFDYLTSRFVDSLGPVAYENAAKAIDWTQSNSHDVELQLTPGLARRMVEQEWPAIKADIDAGRLSPLFLIATPRCGLGDVVGIKDALSHSHQVLAYAYDLDGAGNLALTVYDPNDSGNNASAISLNISNPSNTIQISAPAIYAALDDGHVMRGFFRSAYAYHDPSALGLRQLNNSAVVSQNVPQQLSANTATQVSVTLRNTGVTMWSPASGYQLGSQDPQDNTTWGANRRPLSGPVEPGDEAVFTFPITAAPPPAAVFQWRMVQESVEWFGDLTPAVEIATEQPAICVQLTAEITALDNQIANLQRSLTQPEANKPSILRQIGEAETQVSTLQRQKAQNGCP